MKASLGIFATLGLFIGLHAFTAHADTLADIKQINSEFRAWIGPFVGVPLGLQGDPECAELVINEESADGISSYIARSPDQWVFLHDAYYAAHHRGSTRITPTKYVYSNTTYRDFGGVDRITKVTLTKDANGALTSLTQETRAGYFDFQPRRFSCHR